MQVAIIAPVDPLVEKPGGTRTYVMNLVNSREESEIDFFLVGVDFDKTDGDPSFEFVPAVVSSRVSSMKFLRGLMKVAKKIAFPKDTIIHAQRPDHLFPFQFRNHPAKKLCTLHGQMSRSVKERRGVFYGYSYDKLESYSLRRVDHVIAVDNATLNQFVTKYPFLSEKSSLIPVGIDIDAWKPRDRLVSRKRLGFADRERIALYVGRLEKEKRIDLLIESIPSITGRENCSLVVVGDGTLRKNLETLSERTAPGRVRFVGFQPTQAVRELMGASDVFCLASDFESGPLVVLESLASGTPVVSTDVGRVREFMPDSSTGRIVTQDTEAFANAVVEVLRIERQEMSTKCVERARNFSFQKTFEESVRVYENLSRMSK
ncbi:MAG: glycosyltransferase family 4 protein [Thermoplasmata archaeon]